MKKDKIKLFLVLSFLITFISIGCLGFSTWAVGNFGDVSFEQYYFGITGPTAGTPLSIYLTILMYVMLIIVVSIIITILYFFVLKKIHIKMLTKKIILSLISITVFLFSVFTMSSKLKIGSYLFSKSTSFFEDHYVEPSSNIIEFPEKKKNLVFIYLESYESTFFSKELGGNIDYNLLPNLTSLLQEDGAVNFSNTNLFGGPTQAPETGYSIAGMFAMQSGLPFKVPLSGVDYGGSYSFATGTITLGDILQTEGYNLEFLAGTEGAFAGVDNFYQTHGDWNILDYRKAIEEGRIPKDYKEWWGFEDSKLYDYSKDRLDAVSKDDKPFAMIIEATDSHFPDGYLDKSCPSSFDKPYENSISCVDQMTYDFIEYIKAQDYYKDTVIVLHGDHLSMDKSYFPKNETGIYERTTFNAYLNIDSNLIQSANTRNRQMYSMDVFPTTLAAMDVTIKNDRLGVGTNLFSSTPTLYEELGKEYIDIELARKSNYFFEEFLFSKRKYK